MSVTRFYKVEDKAIISAISDRFKEIEKAQRKANKSAKSYGFEREEGALRQWHLWEVHLGGFYCGSTEHYKRKDKEFWTKPKEGITRPKKIKKSPYFEDYAKLCREIKIDSDNIDKLVGFNHMAFFPSSVGYHYISDKGLFIFKAPESCKEINGSVEISNIDYLKLIDEK